MTQSGDLFPAAPLKGGAEIEYSKCNASLDSEREKSLSLDQLLTREVVQRARDVWTMEAQSIPRTWQAMALEGFAV